jgi:hypothetical protein
LIIDLCDVGSPLIAEAAVLQDNLGFGIDFPKVCFLPHTLLAGAKAEELLRMSTWRKLNGQEGLVVNLGCMTISELPRGFLGGAAVKV